MHSWTPKAIPIDVHVVGLITNRIATHKPTQPSMIHSVAVVHQPGLAVTSAGGVGIGPDVRAGVAGRLEGGSADFGGAVRRVAVAFENGAGGANQGRDIEVGVVEGVKALVERAVGGGVAVAEDHRVDVSVGPDVLAIGIGGDGAGRRGAFFDGLPLVRVVEVPGFGKRAAGVGLFDGAAVVGRVGVLGNDVLAVLDLDHAVPGVEGGAERFGRAGRLG